MKKFFACALLITVPVIPAAFPLALPTLLTPLTPISVATTAEGIASFSTDTTGPIPADGVCLVEGYRYKLLKDEQKQWQKNQGVVATLCSRRLEFFAETESLGGAIAQEEGASPEEIRQGFEDMFLFSFKRRMEIEGVEGFEQKAKDLEQAIDELCPHTNEPLDAYISRVGNFAADVRDSKLSTKDLFEDAFWDAPWEIKRYLLAMNIELGLLDPNEPLPVSHLTPLDHAAQEKDEDLIFLLWERFARKANHHETLGYVKKDIMMRSKDERSIEILREIVKSEDGRSDDCLTFEWATDLDPDFVMRKLNVLIKPVYNMMGDVRPKLYFLKKRAEDIPGDTPGAQMLKNFVQQHGAIEPGCQIL